MVLFNTWLTVVGIFGSLLTVVCSIFAGAGFTKSRSAPVCFVFGALFYSVIITVLTLFHIAYQWLIALVFLAALLKRRRVSLPDWRFVVVISPFLAYAFLTTGVNAVGGDLANYHLVIPRSVLWEHGFLFNPFSHEAGLSYGWHMFGVGAFLLGAERGYVLLSFWAFAMLCWLVFDTFSNRYGMRTGLAAAFVTGYVVCGLVRESIANNDVPLMLVDAAALFMVLKGNSWGLLSGFSMSIKLTAVGTPLALALIRIAKDRSVKNIAVAAAMAAPIAFLWPVVTYLNTGSPLPQVMTKGVPQLSDTMAFLAQAYGLWYKLNYFQQFSNGMIGLGILILAIPLGLLSKEFQRDKFIWAIAAFGVFRFVFTVAAARRADVFWHDRYHTITYLILALIGLLAIRATLAQTVRTEAGNATRVALAWVAVCAVLVQFVTSSFQEIPAGEHNERIEIVSQVSMLNRMSENLATFKMEPGAGPYGVGFDWIAKHLSKEALIATTVVDPYYLQHRYIELLPVSQTRIDLRGSPEAILAELRRRGVTHLHLVQYSGFNVWMNSTIDRWLVNLRKTPELPGVTKLAVFINDEGKGREELYSVAIDDEKIVQQPPFAPMAVVEYGTAIVRWAPCNGYVSIYRGGRLIGLVQGRFGEYWTRQDIHSGIEFAVDRDDGEHAKVIAQ